jgi:hypothetical protein
MWHTVFRAATGTAQLLYLKRVEKWIRFKKENKQKISYHYKQTSKAKYILNWFAVYDSYKNVVKLIDEKRAKLKGNSMFYFIIVIC